MHCKTGQTGLDGFYDSKWQTYLVRNRSNRFLKYTKLVLRLTIIQNGGQTVVILGELRVSTFYFMNERQKILIKLQVQWKQWFRKIIYQNFLKDWIEEPFNHGTYEELKRSSSNNKRHLCQKSTNIYI